MVVRSPLKANVDYKILEDRTSLNALTEMMPPPERDEYKAYAALELESSFHGRRMVVFDLERGEPTKIETFVVGDFWVTPDGPPSCSIRLRHGQSAVISTVPSRFADRELFLSIPQRFEFRWGGREINGQVSFQAHFALLFKTRHKHHHALDGFTYCLSQKRFTQDYPKFIEEARV